MEGVDTELREDEHRCEENEGLDGPGKEEQLQIESEVQEGGKSEENIKNEDENTTRRNSVEPEGENLDEKAPQTEVPVLEVDASPETVPEEILEHAVKMTGFDNEDGPPREEKISAGVDAALNLPSVAGQQAMGDLGTTLPGTHSETLVESEPQQARKASHVPLLEPKLFVGCIGKQTTLSQLVTLFEPYGRIVESSILKNLNGLSKGCGFISYSTPEECLEAIKHLHQQHLFPGSASPIQVSFANPKRERKMKRTEYPLQREPKRISHALAHRPEPLPGRGKSGYGTYGKIPCQAPAQQSYSGYVPQQQTVSYGGMYEPQIVETLPVPGVSGMQGTFGAYNVQNNINMGAAYSEMLGAGLGHVSNMGMSFGASMPMGQTAVPSYGGGQGFEQPASGHHRSDSKCLAGPPGANLFVLGLPEHFTNEDLMQLFSHCGQLAEVRISFDHQTHKSKGYGFVSYQNVQAADLAMQTFNGYSLGNKVLKIEKRRKQL